MVSIGELANDGRDPCEAGQLGCAKAALASHELIAIRRLGDENGLEHAVLANAVNQLREGFLVHPLPRLVRVAPDAIDRELERRRRASIGALWDEGRKTAPKPSSMTLRADGHQATSRAAAGA